MINVAIIGAGSIGNHLTYSSRKLNWTVTVFDSDPKALKRMQNEIYPSRYGKFDTAISLSEISALSNHQVGDFDLIMIGTPPDTHYELARQAARLKPKICFIEKPACQPDLTILEALKTLIEDSETKFVVGYNHRASLIVKNLLSVISDRNLGKVVSLDVSWLESWSGILKAHPWLTSPMDSYLGYSNRGGGALFEHSHGIDLWLFLAKKLQLGDPRRILARADFDRNSIGEIQHDQRIEIDLETEYGFIGHISQDILTEAVDKSIKLESEFYVIDVHFGTLSKTDKLRVCSKSDSNDRFEVEIAKQRPHDFDEELFEIDKMLKGIEPSEYLLDIPSGFDTAFVATAAMMSAIECREIFLSPGLLPIEKGV